MKILITGSASGIGFALSKRLIRQGHFVYMTVHTKNEIKTTLDKIKQLNYKDRVSVIKLDILKKKDINLITKLDIDCLVNLTGVGYGGSLLNLDISKIKENFNINFFNTLELIKTYILSRENKPSKIVVTSSLIGYLPIPYLASYSSSKAALTNFIETFSKELKNTNLNCKIKLIEPGAYNTGFNQYMIENKENLDNSYFLENMDTIIEKQKKLFELIEKKSLTSIINTFDLAINSNTNRVKYKVPISQALFTKIYLLLFK